MNRLRWDPCVFQSQGACQSFFASFFTEQHRRCLLVAGCGFDPRAMDVPRMFATTGVPLRAIFLREERPNPQPLLKQLADQHQEQLRSFMNNSDFPQVQIFDEGKTAVGGRRAVGRLQSEMAGEFTDIIIDISALSVGVFFPVIRAALAHSDRLRRAGAIVNVHVFAVEVPSLDQTIRGVMGDAVTYMHGFRSSESLDATQDRPLLWLPTLALGNVAVLSRIHSFISKSQVPIDVCPIVAFPAQDARLPDKLVIEYHQALSSWKTDGRSFLYAAENDPPDCYRTICSIVEERERTFHRLGGSSVILSPAGNKLLALGAMMAAIERNLPVAMVESLGYEEQDVKIFSTPHSSQIHHVWLAGDAYFELPA